MFLAQVEEVSAGVPEVAAATAAAAVSPAVEVAKSEDLGDLYDSLKTQSDKPAVPAAPAAPTPAPPAEPAAPAVPADPHAAAPRSWTPKAAETWATLPADIRAEVVRRENDFHKGIGQYKEAAEYGTTFRNVLAPYEQSFRQHNVDPIQSVRSLLQAQQTLAFGDTAAKTQLLHQIARQYGVSLGEASAPDPLNFLPPEVTDLQRKYAELQSLIGATQGDIQQSRAEKVNAEIDLFAKNPDKPYFNDIANDMADLIDKGLAKGLDDAYERAVWANPATREKLLAKQQASSLQSAAEATAAKTAASKAALQVGAKAAVQPGAALRSKPQSLDAALSSTYDALFSK